MTILFRLALFCLLGLPGLARADSALLDRFLAEVPAAELMDGADGYGAPRSDIPVAPVLRDGETIGWAFVNSSFVGTTGYSGKPIHILVALDPQAVVQGVRLVKHSEPIVLIGIPEERIAKLTADFKGRDIAAEARGEAEHPLDIISGVTVTIMVIDDSILRSSLRVARALNLGGLGGDAAPAGPQFELNPDAVAAPDWDTLVGDGTVRRMVIDVAELNAAFAATNPRAGLAPEPGPDEDAFADIYMTVPSVPAIGQVMLLDRERQNVLNWLNEGDHAVMLMGLGRFSFKGSGYVRGGLFDRIQIIQGDTAFRFRDRDHKRVGDVAADGAPRFKEQDLFRIPADSGFDPAQPWRLQLLVGREVGALDRIFTTFESGWQPPAYLVTELAPPPPSPAPMQIEADEQAAMTALWQRIWRDKALEIVVLGVMLTILTGVFFFQGFVTRHARGFYWFRMGFLAVTLGFLGWYANAQLSVVNLMALAASLQQGFTWSAFLLDPLTFILWFSIAAALIFWGRGAYCGWLCPFGALQELTNQIARWFKVPQWTLPWGLHERLWAVKYILFLGLFGVSLASIEQAETLAEIEPFKTAIVLKFDRAWPFVLYVMVLLGIGLFIERFYCRYLCPLGGALAIPARMRMFDWLKRYRECGSPCQTCANECFVQAIHPTGEINPNECLNCLNCQVLYQSTTKCPVVIKKMKRRETASGGAAALDRVLTNHPNQTKQSKGHDHV